MSLGQIKLRNWPSRYSDYHEILHIYAHSCRKYISRGIATKLAAQRERHDTCVSSTDGEETAANDNSEQVSTVKRRSASGDGVDALNTRVTDTNLGEVSRCSLSNGDCPKSERGRVKRRTF